MDRDIVRLNAELEQKMEIMFEYMDRVGLESWESEVYEQLGKTTGWLGHNLVCLMSAILVLKRAEKSIQLNELGDTDAK